MNRLQKMAWYNLILIVVVLTLTGTVVAVLGISYARGGWGVLGSFGFLGLSPLLFRKKHGKTDLDERDQFILKRAMLIAYSAFWTAWILGSMIAFAIIRPGNSVPVDVLPLTVLAGGIVVLSVQSIAILVQYGWREKGNE